MKTKIVIDGEFPSLNEIVAVSKSHYGAYAKQKKQYTEIAGYSFLGKKKIEKRARFTFTWYRKNRRSDPDNISAGQKYILDAMVTTGFIKSDGWKHVKGIAHEFEIDTKNPRVEILIEEEK